MRRGKQSAKATQLKPQTIEGERLKNSRCEKPSPQIHWSEVGGKGRWESEMVGEQDRMVTVRARTEEAKWPAL